MGRKPDPNYIRELKGKKPRIPMGHQVSFPLTTTLTPPAYFTKEAQHHWERMSLILAEVRLLQEVGRDKLARYCQACADYEEIMMARKALGKKRIIIHDDEERQQFGYWARMMELHSKEMTDFEREYGLTPASAARVRRPGTSGNGQSPQEKFKDFLDEAKTVN